MSETTNIPELRCRRFARLPHELQLIILRHVYEPDPKTYLTYLSANPGVHYYEPGPIGAVREWLKPLRLISRLFHDAVTPFIFSSIHLHASELSLLRAENIANSPLAHHVREIVHYEGTFAGASEDKARFQNILKSHRRRRDYPKAKDYTFLLDDELYENYLQEVAAGREQDIFTVDRMTALVQKLPRCVTFSTLRYDTEFGDPLTSAYTLSRTGLSYLPRPTEATELTQFCFISAMTQWSPRVLNLVNFRNRGLQTLLAPLSSNPTPDSDLEPAHNWAGKLTYLKLGWPTHSQSFAVHSQVTSDSTRLLTSLFQNCHSLVHLELVHPFEIFPDTPLFPENSLPNLTHLTLTGDAMDSSWAEETLFNCIKKLGSTLKHVHFQNISLERLINGPHMRGRDGSLLRLLFNLTPFVDLDSCTGLETVIDIKSNVRMKHAFVLPGSKPGTLAILQKVQEAVCGQRSWPEGFNMDHLPMDLSASDLANVQETVMTEEAAFIFSSWNDTVDPWDEKIEPNDPVREDERELEAFEGLIGQCRLDDQRAEHTVPKTVGPEANKTGKSKRSRISRALGLKQSRN